MLRAFYILPLLLTWLVITNCSGKEDSPSYVDKLTFEDPDLAQKIMKNLDISCEDVENCPEFVGGLAFLGTNESKNGSHHSTKYSIGVCSQTLTGPNKVLTNRHCLPEDLRYKGARCSNGTIVFPKTADKPEIKVNCKSVAEVSPKYLKSNEPAPDWAILELAEKVNRKYTPPNISGVPHQTSLITFPVYYEKIEIPTASGKTKTIVKGTVKKVACQSKMNSIYAALYNHPKGPILSAVCDHEIIHGNSGTGIVDLQGNLVGVISMGVENNTTYSMLGETKILKTRISIGTNLHCVAAFSYTPSETCNFDENDNATKETGLFLSGIFGQKADPPEKNKFEKALNSDSSVIWEDHSVDFFSQFNYSNDFDNIASKTSHTIAKHVALYDQMVRFPKTPKCILRPRKTDKEFIINWPVFDSKYNGSAMSALSLIELPLEMSLLRLKLNYDDNAQAFEGKLLRLDKQNRTHFLKLRNRLRKLFPSCYFSNSKSKCSQIFKMEEQIAEFISSSGVDPVIFANEAFIEDKDFTTNKVTIPVCD